MGNAPLQIPVTFCTAANVIVIPSVDTFVILLNLSVVSPGNVYLTIVSVLIPAKLLPAHVAIPAAFMFNTSDTLNPVGILRFKTVSATKSH